MGVFFFPTFETCCVYVYIRFVGAGVNKLKLYTIPLLTVEKLIHIGKNYGFVNF